MGTWATEAWNKSSAGLRAFWAARWKSFCGAGIRIRTRLGDHSHNSIYRVVLTVWLTLSIASVIVAALNWNVLSRQLAASDHSTVIREHAEDVLKSLLDAETGQRGFTITGDEAFLESFRSAVTNIPDHFEQLVELTRENPSLLKQVVDLRVLAELSLAYQTEIVRIRQTQGFLAAAAAIKEGNGRQDMNEIRERVTGMVSSSAALLRTGMTESSRRHLMRASLTSLVAGVIGIGAGFLAVYIARVALKHQRQEKELLEAKLESDRTSAEKSTFLANMSHEIRTPMNAILGFSELLSGELREPRHRQYIHSIRTSATSLLRLINDVLEISKIEAGVLKMQLEPTDPAEICDFIKTMFKEQTAAKNLRLDCQLAKDLPRSLMLDQLRMRQILVNLVGNAVKFTDSGGIEVRFRWEREATIGQITLLIEVEDTGMGIPEEKLQTIFQPFVQAGADHEKERQGTGLGLAIVLRITEMMGGTITISSAVGEGTCLELRFPNVLVSAQLPVSESLEGESAVDFNEFQPSTVLVVDDNETNLKLIEGIFEDTHHTVVLVNDGAKALEYVSTSPPDVLLLDIRMAGMDGHAVLGEIRKISGLEMLPVIAVTASSLQSSGVFLENSFNAHLMKPFSRRELYDRLAQFLGRRKKADPVFPDSSHETLNGVDESARKDGDVWPQLDDELNRLLVAPWASLRESLAVNETLGFARKLRAIGQDSRCPPLAAFAEKLISHAESYDVCALEQELLKFPALVRQLTGTKTAGETA